jgi:hypothetical protein
MVQIANKSHLLKNRNQFQKQAFSRHTDTDIWGQENWG